VPDDLVVFPAHRADCVFGTGFYRVYLASGDPRYCQSEAEVRQLIGLVGDYNVRMVERDGHCLDGDRNGDANTPDVVDAERWLGLPQREAMDEVGLTTERDYARVYRQVEAAVSRRNDRASQGGIRAPIVIKKRGRPLIDVLADSDG
jgi:hypothetical protein